MKTLRAIVLGIGVVALSGGVVACGGKKKDTATPKTNPCDGTKKANPCDATKKANPCDATKKANPCDATKKANPCDGAKKNPCNPCAPKTP